MPKAITMDKQLQKLIDLSNKTGDRLVVFDQNNPNSAYVVMGINDYEKMAIGRSEVRGLTEDELVDKINRDIAIWKSDKFDEAISQESKGYFDDNESIREGDDWHSVEEITKKTENKNKKRDAWSIPSDRKEKAEEIIEEDRYYLETLED